MIIDCRQLKPMIPFRFVLDGVSSAGYSVDWINLSPITPKPRSGEFIFLNIKNNHMHFQMPEFMNEDWTCSMPLFHGISDQLNQYVKDNENHKLVKQKMIKINNRYYKKTSILVETTDENQTNN